MWRTSLKSCVLVLLVAVMLGLSAAPTQACWWTHRVWDCGGCGPWTCCYSPVVYNPAPCCGWFGWGGGYGCSYDYGCNTCGSPAYTGCGCNAMSTGSCCDGSVVAPAMTPATASPAPTPAPEMPKPVTPAAPQPSLPSAQPGALPHTSGTAVHYDSGLIAIHVPADAKVYVNGYLTKSTGSDRQYVSYGLQPGLSYTYEIRAEVVRDSRTIEQTRRVTLTTGAHAEVAFQFDAKGAASLAASW